MPSNRSTPGPWNVERHFVPSVCAIHSTGRPVEIASIMKRSSARPGDAITEREGEANARLITTAPDGLVLAELTLITTGRMGANSDVNHPLRKVWEAARDLIAKATGAKP